MHFKTIIVGISIFLYDSDYDCFGEQMDVVGICNPDYLNIRILNPIIMLFAHCKC